MVGSAREGRGRVGDFYTRDRSTPLPDQFYVSNTLFLYLFMTLPFSLVAVAIVIVVPMVVAVVLFVSGELDRKSVVVSKWLKGSHYMLWPQYFKTNLSGRKR